MQNRNPVYRALIVVTLLVLLLGSALVTAAPALSTAEGPALSTAEGPALSADVPSVVEGPPPSTARGPALAVPSPALSEVAGAVGGSEVGGVRTLGNRSAEAVTRPEDIPDDWWAIVQEDIRRSEYHLTWQEKHTCLAFPPPTRPPTAPTTYVPTLPPRGRCSSLASGLRRRLLPGAGGCA